jgi:PPOX class probable F420-dependent enzyme
VAVAGRGAAPTLPAMASLVDLTALLDPERGLAVVCTTRADTSVQASVVNVGVVDHPVRGEPVVGFVARGGAVKLAHLRRDPRATVVARAGWQWVAVEGTVELAGPDDGLDGFDPSALPELLRAVFRAAGGHHDDWPAYDRAMVEDARAAVLVTPTRVYSNQPS